jgi:hypothetical protein
MYSNIHMNNMNLIFFQIIIIQKYYRRWLSKRYVLKLKDDKRKREEFEKLEEIRHIPVRFSFLHKKQHY